MDRETLQGLHLMMVHEPDLAIQRVHEMQGQGYRWHKLIAHGTKADWIDRMPERTYWDIRNVDISEEPVTNQNAEALGRRHAEIHAEAVAHYKAKGIDPMRVAFEGRNEPGIDEQPFIARYEVARIKRAQELGVPRLIVCNWSVGQPLTYGGRPDTACNWEPYEPIRQAMRPGQDLLGMHLYYGIGGPWEAWPDGNLRWLDEGGRHLQCPWHGIQILVTEAGVDDGVNQRMKNGWLTIPGLSTVDAMAGAYTDMIRWCDTQYAWDGRIAGVTLFTYDYENNEWNKFDIRQNPMWPIYAMYLKDGIHDTLWGNVSVARWRPLIEHWSRLRKVDPRVVATLIYQESTGEPQRTSPGGVYVGLMQLPCREAGYPNYPERNVLKHPSRNVGRGTQLLADCIAAFPGSFDDALNAYFVGLDAAKKGVKATTPLSEFATKWGEMWPGQPCPLKKAPAKPGVIDPAALVTLGQMHLALHLNKDAALQKRIVADGLVPTSEEFEATVNGNALIGQRAESLKTGEVRVYYCPKGYWTNIKYVIK